ncbi:MAG: hypothetical protein QXV17_07975 [Candidatus Micrarchaeaceae archaeon]
MAKEKKVLTDEQKQINAKKDLFWRVFFLMFFIGSFLYANLSQYKWYSGVFTIIIVVVCILAVVFAPGWLYNQKWIKEQYDIFQDKKWKTSKDDAERAKAKIYYNISVFFILSVFSYLIAGVFALYLFNKSSIARLILTAVLIIVSLFVSIKLTEFKSKEN